MSLPGRSDPGTSDQNITQMTYQREAPDIESRRVQLMDTAAKLAAEGKQPTAGDITLPTQQVAGFDPLQTQGFGMVGAGVGSYIPYMTQALQQTLGSTAAYDPSTAYQQYMNPYQSEVIGGIEDQFAKLQNQAAARGVQTGAFGGAREGIQTAELGRQQAQAVGQAQALHYGQAQQLAQQQLQQGDVAGVLAAGATKQQREQQIADAQYRQQLQQLYEPFQRLGFVSDIYQGAPSSGMSIAAGTTPQTNPLAQTVGAGLTGLAAYQGFQNMMG